MLECRTQEVRQSGPVFLVDVDQSDWNRESCTLLSTTSPFIKIFLP